ncbi:uncharacterized protein SPPG_04214 [Spizellomyces punctatus DAOM BR117]|uniref:Uncharacterized protein n=1 Tax=Spizellomyces punctatus (strain DAOM BR117) TaxID=645134 RepID=A0A0L0HJC9_SPIPD|nr:uncharacterized protein SPPG_04214 [Spizellomyces punctatus DAOM BR117]KND01123.1 hypothetical protein SPPG_04214 [Spizellomyces punctatus DAOM BR117]|eukprot:XP_016609162.1 hypothetical protein SPPG_04214 [Spizellomyces punctatus DAOM BR117]
MGCDGGSIPRRDELVKTKKAAERADPRIQLIAAWFFCALSKQPLAVPVVACALGKLYNKDAILEFLLNKGGYGDGDLICKHITSFKDVVTLNLTPNPAFKSNSDAATVLGNIDERPLVSRFSCPISGREMNGNYRFSYIATCGCVFSDQALKEVPSSTCLKCNKPYSPEDVLPINPTQEDEIARLQQRMETLKAHRAKEAEEKKRQKKEKKKKSKGAEADKTDEKPLPALRSSSGSEGDSPDTDGAAKKRKKSKKEQDEEDRDLHVVKKMATTASNINMPLPDLQDRSHLPLALRVQSAAIKSLYKKKDEKEDVNFLTRGTFNRFAATF